MPITENDHQFTAQQYPGTRDGLWGWPVISQIITGCEYTWLFGKWAYVQIFGQEVEGWPVGDGDPFNGLVTARYTERLEVGYRYYNANKVAPRFPFGWGLTYTTFDLSDLNTNGGNGDGSLTWSVTVTNIGKRSGVETVQGYLTYPEHAGEPPRQLKSFGQTDTIAPGGSFTFTDALAAEEMKVWSNEKGGWVTLSGHFIFCVGKHVNDENRVCVDFETTVTKNDDCVWHAGDPVSTSNGFTSEGVMSQTDDNFKKMYKKGFSLGEDIIVYA